MARKILFILLGLVIVLALVLVGALFFVRSSATTKTDGALTVAGLQSTVTVYRDQNGVPNIYADNTHDLFFAQGYVQAQDRLFQMDFQRRVGLGRLSEVLGEATLKTDQFLRTLGSGRAAAEDLAMLSDDTLAILQAYADGVNAFIAANPDKLPVEFRILGYTPEPWQPLHSVAWGKMMAWNLGGNWETELMTAQLIEALGPEAAATLMARYPEEGPFIIPPEVKSFAGLGQIDMSQVWAIKRLLKVNDPGVGSNNWVVAGSRTTTGMPLLANDPHLGMQIPSVWYVNGLHGAGFDVVGVVFPGVPGVVIGHNSRIAWGVTNLGPDVQDMFIEKINPDNPNQYEFQGQWLDMQVIEEPILVKGRTEPVIQTVRITRHGPIMNAVSSDIGESAPPLAMQWTALQGTPLSQAILRIDQAQNWEQFRAALQDFAVPAQNFVYADVEGNIGYQYVGRIPRRRSGFGLLPSRGWTGEGEWEGWLPFDELPRAFNPPQGYALSANNKPAPDDYPHFLGADWFPGYRATRIERMLQARPRFTVRDFQNMQCDLYSVQAESLQPYMIMATGSGLLEQRIVRELETWNLFVEVDSFPAAAYEVMRIHLLDLVFGDKLGPLSPHFKGISFSDIFAASAFTGKASLALANLLEQEEGWWYHDAATGQPRTRQEVLDLALQATAVTLHELIGKEPRKWAWGKVHQVEFAHLFGRGRFLRTLFNRGQYPIGGDEQTVWMTASELQMPFGLVTTSATYRQVLDVGDWDRCTAVLSTGQSGQPTSAHYADMIDLWREGEQHPMLWTRPAVDAQAVVTLWLRPRLGRDA